MVTWKIVKAPKASVLYIYIYIDGMKLTIIHVDRKKKIKQINISLLELRKYIQIESVRYNCVGQGLGQVHPVHWTY